MKVLLTTIKSEAPASKLVFKYLYGVLEKAPIDITVTEFEQSDLRSDIYEQIVRGGYSIVYFHVEQDNTARIDAIAEMVKKAVPTSIVVVGGMQASFDPEEYMQTRPYVDFVVRGECEHVMFNFLKTVITYKFDFEAVAGLAYRDNDDIIVNPYDAPVQLEDLPFPYERDGIDPSNIVYYESFRGAADRCKYAQFIDSFNIRSLSLNRICTELRYFLVKNVDKVIFTDKWFNYNANRAYRIWEYILNNDNGHTCFYFDIDGDNLDEETIRLLATAREGLFEFNVDIESTNPEVLYESGRKENIYQLLYNVTKLIGNKNVKVNVNLKAGMPYETKELFGRSFNKVYGLGADSLKVQALTFPVGCKLRDEAEKYGYQYSSVPPYRVISSGHINALELIKIREITSIADAYLGEGGFETSIARILTDTAMKPYDLFARLSEFIYNSGLTGRMRKTEDLYRVLYAFATDIYEEIDGTLKIQILKDILHAELEGRISTEAIKKFDKKGWEI